jgi:hypothetical protein
VLPLGSWVLEEACRQLKLWHAEGVAPQTLSVNVSGVQFKGSSELEREVEACLTRWDIDPSNLELTESVLMEATQRHSNTLQNLRQLGTKIAIDDFGTGYSSLKYLTTYPVNRLKLALEFVYRVTVDYRNAAVVRAAIRLAHELGLDIIAEGVETEAQVRFLRAPAASRRKATISAGRSRRSRPRTCSARGGSGQPPAPCAGSHPRRRERSRNQRLQRVRAQRVEAAAVALGRTRAPRACRLDAAGGGRLLRDEILVKGASEARRASGLGGANDAHHEEPAGRCGRHHVARVNEPACLHRAGAIDADLAGRDQPRGSRSRLDQPCAPQPLVEPLP